MEKQRGRPRKFTNEELKARLVQAGIEAVEFQGLSQALDAANLDAAIRAADVPRGSAYRVWNQDTDGAEDGETPQDQFRSAVLVAILRGTPGHEGLTATYEAAARELEQQAGALESGDPERVDRAAQALMRVAGIANFEEIKNSQRWRVYKALAVAATTRLDENPEVLAALNEGEERMFQGYMEFFKYVAKLFGLQLCPEYSLAEFTMCVIALNEGLSNRVTTGYRLTDIPRATGLNGQTEAWSLFSVGFEALVRQFFRPVATDEDVP